MNAPGSGDVGEGGRDAGTSPDAGVCDDGDCGTCGDGALGGGACQDAISACLSDADCNALVACMSPCVDEACADTCATQYPGGVAGYEAVETCVLCTACPVSCAGEVPGGCTP
jgi:hypothetical protein